LEINWAWEDCLDRYLIVYLTVLCLGIFSNCKVALVSHLGDNLLLRLDNSGEPMIQAYYLKPAEVIPKNE